MPTQLYALRAAITEFIGWVKKWEDPDPAVMVQALWLLNLAGVANSGVHEAMKLRVLMLMRDLARQDIRPKHALELLKGWEADGQAD